MSSKIFYSGWKSHRPSVRLRPWTTAAQCGMIASMAIWDDVPTGRWVVEEVSWVVSTGQRTLQRALNEGESHGYELRAVVPTKDELLVIWEKPAKYG